ncbi:hypothetical protein GEMRC1_001758 [Eukaryota sp. GEM-RC1]
MIVSNRRLFTRKTFLTKIIHDFRNSQTTAESPRLNNSPSVALATPPIIDSRMSSPLLNSIRNNSPSSITPLRSSLSISSEDSPSPTTESPDSSQSLLSRLLAKYPTYYTNEVQQFTFHINLVHPELPETSQQVQLKLSPSLTVSAVISTLLAHLNDSFPSNSPAFIQTPSYYDLKMIDDFAFSEDDYDLPIDHSSRLSDLGDDEYILTFSSLHPLLKQLELYIDVEGVHFPLKVNGQSTGGHVLRLLEEQGVEVGGRVLLCEPGPLTTVQAVQKNIVVNPMDTLLSVIKPFLHDDRVCHFSLVVPQVLADSLKFYFNDKIVSEYVEYAVIKINRAGVRQHRIMGIDTQKVHNILPRAQDIIKYVWKRKRPVTRFWFVRDIVDINLLGRRSFTIVYNKTTTVNNRLVVPYEAYTQKDALEIVYRLKYLQERKFNNSGT